MPTMQPPATSPAPRITGYHPALHPASPRDAMPDALPHDEPALPARPRPTRGLLDRVTWWSDRRRLSLRELKQELLDAEVATHDGVIARMHMLVRLDADLATAETAWHPNAGPDVTWPMSIWKQRYRGIEDLLRPH